jgi:hypothetical protein
MQGRGGWERESAREAESFEGSRSTQMLLSVAIGRTSVSLASQRCKVTRVLDHHTIVCITATGESQVTGDMA